MPFYLGEASRALDYTATQLAQLQSILPWYLCWLIQSVGFQDVFVGPVLVGKLTTLLSAPCTDLALQVHALKKIG
jgi:hypothetical protein